MTHKFINHLPHYLPLIGILLFGIIGYRYFSYDQGFQNVVSLSIALSYVVWGIVHHKLHKDLYLEVIFEYIFISILGLIALLLL